MLVFFVIDEGTSVVVVVVVFVVCPWRFVRGLSSLRGAGTVPTTPSVICRL